MVIITHNLGLRFDDESYHEFIQLYGRRAGTCRATSDRAVCECLEDASSAYVLGNGRPYMNAANHKLARRTANQRLSGPSCAENHVLCSCSGGAGR